MGKSHLDERILPPFKNAVENDYAETVKTPLASDVYDFFALAPAQTKPVGFKIHFAEGNSAAIYYHDFVSPLEYDGKELIEIKIPAATISITGRNLGLLFDYLFENRVAWIKEPDSSFIDVTEDQPDIEKIKIEHKD